MKCPKCGFVSYPGLVQCKKCGYRFVPAAPQEAASLFSRWLSDLHPSSPPVTLGTVTPPTPPAEVAEAAPAVELGSGDDEMASVPAEPAPAAPPAPRPPQAWQQELAEKVESFRRRRARLKQGAESEANLELNFEPELPGVVEEPPQILAEPDLALPDALEEAPQSFEDRNSALPVDQEAGGFRPEESRFPEFPQTEAPIDVELGPSSRPESELPVLEASPLEKPEATLPMLSSAAVQAGDLSLASGAPEPAREPMEIVVGAPEPAAPPAPQEAGTLVLTLAPLGRRFTAGLLDALVLLVGAGLFALIFWRAGGHLRPEPLNLAVLGFIAVFFILVYFGLFTAFTSSTPGLLWMGCEVRNLEGAHPTAQESFLRAFGYLVSISALMLGFLWALLDSEGLSWHDRMSGTFISNLGDHHEGRGSEF